MSASSLLSGNPPDTDAAGKWCDNAISFIHAAQAYLGGSVTLLQSRINFIGDYADTLGTGADKMTLADLNQESAQFVALQTRQQIAIQAISVSGQQSASILSLLK